MAYLRPLIRQCAMLGCDRVAKHALYNARNAHLGDYCSRHAKERLRQLKSDEEKVR